MVSDQIGIPTTDGLAFIDVMSHHGRKRDRFRFMSSYEGQAALIGNEVLVRRLEPPGP